MAKYVILKVLEGFEAVVRRDRSHWSNEFHVANVRLPDPDAVYFVLRLDGDHDPHARVAVAAYADSVEADNPELATDIRERLSDIAAKGGDGGKETA